MADFSLYQHTMRHNQALSQSSSYSIVTWFSLSTSYSTIKWFSNLTKIQDEQPTIRTFPQRSSGTRAGERTTLKSVYGRSPLSLHGSHTEKTKLKKNKKKNICIYILSVAYTINIGVLFPPDPRHPRMLSIFMV